MKALPPTSSATDVTIILPAFGPFIAAFALTFLNKGKEGVVKLLKRGFDYRFGKIWFILILFFPSGICVTFLLLTITENPVTQPLLNLQFIVPIFHPGQGIGRIYALILILIIAVIVILIWGG